MAWASPALAARLAKLGVLREADLILHLPLRYEDETRLTHVADLPDAPWGEPVQVQVEVEVLSTEVSYRPRRQLISRVRDVCDVPDARQPSAGAGRGLLVVRLVNFYPSQQQQYEPGARLRLFGEVREGYFGLEMVHPRAVAVTAETPLPETLTPVAGASTLATAIKIGNPVSWPKAMRGLRWCDGQVEHRGCRSSQRDVRRHAVGRRSDACAVVRHVVLCGAGDEHLRQRRGQQPARAGAHVVGLLDLQELRAEAGLSPAGAHRDVQRAEPRELRQPGVGTRRGELRHDLEYERPAAQRAVRAQVPVLGPSHPSRGDRTAPAPFHDGSRRPSSVRTRPSTTVCPSRLRRAALPGAAPEVALCPCRAHMRARQ